MRDKIWKAAMELHYVPNEAARDLKHGKQGDNRQTHYLQVLVTRSDVGQTDPFIEELLRVIESEVHKHLCILTHVWHRSVFSDERRCKKEDVNRIVADLCKETAGNSHGLIIIGKISKHAIPAIRKHFAHVVAVNRNQLGQQLDEYQELGVRGIRVWNRFPFNFQYLEKLAPRLAERGWHACLFPVSV